MDLLSSELFGVHLTVGPHCSGYHRYRVFGLGLLVLYFMRAGLSYIYIYIVGNIVSLTPVRTSWLLLGFPVHALGELQSRKETKTRFSHWICLIDPK